MKSITLNTFRRIINCHGTRFYSSQILPTNDEFTWHTSKPVKLRIEVSAPVNHKPILVQEMMRQTVSQSGSHTAIVSYDDTIKWTYDEYYAKAVLTAKAFISLGLTPGHGVGIMALNHPNWHLSNLGAIFAGQSNNNLETKSLIRVFMCIIFRWPKLWNLQHKFSCYC